MLDHGVRPVSGDDDMIENQNSDTIQQTLELIADPCCGSGGFFLAAQAFIADTWTLDREQKEFLKNETFYGNELVATTYKLCLMNLYLHNIGDIYGNVPVRQGDSLLTDPGYRVDYVLTIIWSLLLNIYNVYYESLENQVACLSTMYRKSGQRFDSLVKPKR